MGLGAILDRPCLGRTTVLGAVYDARTETFCSRNIFQNGVPTGSIRKMEATFTEYRVVTLNSPSEKFATMNVPGEMQLSLLAGTVSPTGWGKFLTSQNHSPKSGLKTFIFRTKTVDESVNLIDTDVMEAISVNHLSDVASVGTHVVQQISWGASEIMTYPCNKSRLIEDQEEVKYFSDATLNGELVISNPEDVEEFMRAAPSRMSNVNEGKGLPQTMRLIPIQQVQMYMEQPVTSVPVFIPVGEVLVGKIVRAFEQFSVSQRELDDFNKEVVRFEYCFKPETIESISKFCYWFSSWQTTRENPFPAQLATILKEVRGGVWEHSRLEDFVTELRHASSRALAIRSNFAEVNKKISIAKLLKSKGFQYIGRDASVEEELSKAPNDRKSFVLYFSRKWRDEEHERWTRNMRLVLDKSEEESSAKFFAVDCDFHSCPEIVDTCVQVVNGGNVVAKDLLAEQEEK